MITKWSYVKPCILIVWLWPISKTYQMNLSTLLFQKSNHRANQIIEQNKLYVISSVFVFIPDIPV